MKDKMIWTRKKRRVGKRAEGRGEEEEGDGVRREVKREVGGGVKEGGGWRGGGEEKRNRNFPFFCH